MTTAHIYRAGSDAMVQPFPTPGRLVRYAYRELHAAENGDDAPNEALGDINKLPRPWVPATCTDPELRAELWTWLEAAVVWLNHELVFDTVDVIPACWPQHPHLVHEIAVLVDLRRKCDLSLASDLLEEWHRYALPAFLERMRHRVAEHCNPTHSSWPAVGRFKRLLSTDSCAERNAVFVADIKSLRSGTADKEVSGPPRLSIVDIDTGEILG